MSDIVPSTGSKAIVLKKPEKIAGTIAVAGVAAGAGYGLYKLMPFLVTMTWGVLQIAVALTLSAILLYIVMDKQTRAVFGRGYRLMIRGIWRAVMKYDPIGNLKEHIVLMKEKAAQMDENRGVLAGQVTALKRQIDQNEREKQEALAKAKVARDQKAEDVVTYQGRLAGRREASNVKFTKLLGTLETSARILAKMRKNLGFLIQDTEDEVEQITREFMATKAAGAAAENAMEIINGDPRMREMYAETMEYLEQEVADRVGKFNMMFEDSQGLMQSIDIQNAMYKESALKQLEAWEAKSDEFLLNPSKRGELGPASEPVPVERKSVDALFEKH